MNAAEALAVEAALGCWCRFAFAADGRGSQYMAANTADDETIEYYLTAAPSFQPGNLKPIAAADLPAELDWIPAAVVLGDQ